MLTFIADQFKISPQGITTVPQSIFLLISMNTTICFNFSFLFLNITPPPPVTPVLYKPEFSYNLHNFTAELIKDQYAFSFLNLKEKSLLNKIN